MNKSFIFSTRVSNNFLTPTNLPNMDFWKNPHPWLHWGSTRGPMVGWTLDFGASRVNCQLCRRLLQTFFSHPTYMNGLSLEFEGSTGQNEPGIFQGGARTSNLLWGSTMAPMKKSFIFSTHVSNNFSTPTNVSLILTLGKIHIYHFTIQHPYPLWTYSTPIKVFSKSHNSVTGPKKTLKCIRTFSP